MATKKYIELQGMSDESLQAELVEINAQYKKMKYDHAVRGLENPLKLREVRRDIARLMTEVRNRSIKAMDDKAVAKRSKIRSRRRKAKA